MSFIPPFCPYTECTLHVEGPHPGQWYKRNGTHSTLAFGEVQRYKCHSCGRTFSVQTFKLRYYAKRIVNYQEMFKQLCSTAGIRDLSRNLHLSRGTVQNSLFRMARWSLALHADVRIALHLQENLCADGFESYTLSKYWPHHLNILVGSHSRYLYALEFTTLRRKGTMTAIQLKRRAEFEQRCHADPKGVQRSFCRLLEEMLQLCASRAIPTLTLVTDEHKAYPRAAWSHPTISHLLRKGFITLHQISSKLPRTPDNPLFPVNYMDRQLRKDMFSYVRESVGVAKNVSALLDRICVYRLHHNYCKPFLENKPTQGATHGSEAGCDMRQVESKLARLFQERPFASLLPLTIGEEALWFRRYKSPLKTRPEYVPAYALG